MKTKKPVNQYRWLIFQFLMALLVFSACNNNAEKQKNLNDLNDYVGNHKHSMEIYIDSDWVRLDGEFVAKREKLDKDTASMSAEMKESYYRAVNDWNQFGNDYRAKLAERKKVGQMDVVRKALALPDTRTDFTDLPAKDVLKAYEHFVSRVRDNKDVYTKEEWTVVNVDWKALNGRMREVEKNIPKGDGPKIIKLQMEYTAIKAINRPMAENP